MKPSAIQIGKKYEVNADRGVTIVKVIDTNPKTGVWICETLGGKDIAIGDAKRFIKTVDDGKRPKKNTAKATTHLSEKPTASFNQPADLEIVTQLRDAFKEADRRLRIARTALQIGLINQGKLDTTTVEYNEALAALKAAGGKAGTGGRCLGKMSGVEAAYKVLSETGKPMNARQICEMALDQGYWEPQGSTPEASISTAIIIEMRKKGDDARFERVGRGLFAIKK